MRSKDLSDMSSKYDADQDKVIDRRVAVNQGVGVSGINPPHGSGDDNPIPPVQNFFNKRFIPYIPSSNPFEYRVYEAVGVVLSDVYVVGEGWSRLVEELCGYRIYRELEPGELYYRE
jgi:hypothetical protein